MKNPKTDIQRWAPTRPRLRPSTALGAALLAGALSACGGGKEAAPPVQAAPKAATTAAPAAPQKQVSNEAKVKFDKAVKALAAAEKTGNYDDAVSLFRDAAGEDATLAEAPYNLGVIAERRGKTDEALSYYQRAIKANPHFGPAVANIAAIYVSQQKADEAQQMLESFIQSDPSWAAPRVALAQLYRDKKRYEDALVQCRAALQREPKNMAAFQTMAAAYVDIGNTPMARLALARGLKVDTKDPILHHTSGRIWLIENKVTDAVLEFKASLASAPDYRPAHIDMAEVALQYRDFKNAQTHYAFLVKDTPQDIASWIGLGVSNKGLGKYDDAKQAYEKALAIDGKNPAALMDMAILYHRHLNDFQNALKYYKAYLDTPSNEGPKPEVVRGYITELEQTIAALKEAEKLEQVDKAKQPQKPQEQKSQEAPAQEQAESQAAPEGGK